MSVQTELSKLYKRYEKYITIGIQLFKPALTTKGVVKMRRMMGVIAVCCVVIVCAVVPAWADDTLDGTWNMHIEVLKGPNKGMEEEYTIVINQQLENGTLDGKTIDDSGKQIGRVSGLIKRTIIELAFSFGDDRAMSTMHWSPDGTMMGGIFRLRNGGEGVVYGIKEKNQE